MPVTGVSPSPIRIGETLIGTDTSGSAALAGETGDIAAGVGCASTLAHAAEVEGPTSAATVAGADDDGRGSLSGVLDAGGTAAPEDCSVTVDGGGEPTGDMPGERLGSGGGGGGVNSNERVVAVPKLNAVVAATLGTSGSAKPPSAAVGRAGDIDCRSPRTVTSF